MLSSGSQSFETSILFLEPKKGLSTEIADLQKQ